MVEKDLLTVVDKLSGNLKDRSEFVEAALNAYIAQLERDRLSARDREIIDNCADELNEEALDVLDYKVTL